MLYAGVDAALLYAADAARSHFACEVGIFGIVFEVAPAQRIALHVGAGAEQHVYALRHRFFTQKRAGALGDFGIPAVGNGCR